jgi:hypothetical protein
MNVFTYSITGAVIAVKEYHAGHMFTMNVYGHILDDTRAAAITGLDSLLSD